VDAAIEVARLARQVTKLPPERAARAAAGPWECWQLDMTGWVDLPNSCFAYSDAGRALFGSRAVTTPILPDLYSPPPGATRVFVRRKTARLERRGARLALFNSMHDNVHGFEIRYEVDLATGVIVAAESCTPRLPYLGICTEPQARIASLVGPRVGEDAAVIALGERCLVATTDPITFATDEAAWYAVQVNVNDLAVRGARPRWFLVTLLLPEGATTAALVEQLFGELGRACEEADVALVGGHTEVTHGLDRPVIVGTMLGEVDRDKLVTTGGAQVGDAVVMTKGVPLEGACLLARDREAELVARGVRAAVIRRAKG